MTPRNIWQYAHKITSRRSAKKPPNRMMSMNFCGSGTGEAGFE